MAPKKNDFSLVAFRILNYSWCSEIFSFCETFKYIFWLATISGPFQSKHIVLRAKQSH